MKGTLTSNFSTYLLVERMGLSTQTLWWYLLLSTSSSNSFASAALLPSNERPPSALAAVSKASWEKQQQPGLFLSVAYQHFQWKDVTMQKKMLTGNERRHVCQHVLGKYKYHQQKIQRKEPSQTPKTEQTIPPNNALGKNHRGNIKSCAARALNTDSWWSPVIVNYTHMFKSCVLA